MTVNGRDNRRFYVDDETDRLFFVDDGTEPEGALVEEISAREWYVRAGRQLACGWPAEHHERSENICPCHLIFPACAPEHFHSAELSVEDEEALG